MKTINVIFKNSVLAILFLVAVATAANAAQITKVAVSKVEAVQAIAQYKSQGYILSWIDAFRHDGSVATNSGPQQTLFNLIFDTNTGNHEYYALVGMSGSTYQSKFNYYVGTKKMKLTFVESYKDENNNVRYAAIWVKKSGPAFKAYHGLTQASHQNKFNQFTSEGYRLVTRTTVVVNGQQYVTALYDKKDVGSWVAKSYKNQAQTQALMEANKNAGRTLNHFDVTQTTSSNFDFSMIFDSQPNNGWYAKNGLSANQLQSEISSAKRKGYETTIISGYDIFTLINGNETYLTRFAVCFVKPAGIGGITTTFINP